MSWLSEAWKRLKGGQSDAQAAFSILVAGMSAKDKTKLTADLRNVQYAVDLAIELGVKDTRATKAQQWVDGALDILGG